MVPTGVVRWMLPEISEGSFFAPVMRYAFDLAGPSNRTHTSELQFSPIINIGSPNSWFITIFPSTFGGDIRYNLGSQRPGDKGRLFLPADVMAGKILSWSRDAASSDAVASLEIGVPIVNDYRPPTPLGTYRFKLEARIGFFC